MRTQGPRMGVRGPSFFAHSNVQEACLFNFKVSPDEQAQSGVANLIFARELFAAVPALWSREGTLSGACGYFCG